MSEQLETLSGHRLPLAPDETKLLKHRGLCRLRCWLEGYYAWSIDTDYSTGTEKSKHVLTCDRCGGRRVL